MNTFGTALGAFFLSLSLATFASQTPPSPPTGLSISPMAGNGRTVHQAHGMNFAANATLLAVLFDPSGNESLFSPHTDAKGAFDLALDPKDGAWQDGLYRLVVGLGDGRSISTTFSAGDGQAHVYAQPYSPSPSSAFNIVGVGLPANTTVNVHLWLTGGNLGERDLGVTTDAGGSFSMYVWPEEVGAPFYPAGRYEVSLTPSGLSTSFWVREHPSSATVSVNGPVQPGVPAPAVFSHYSAGRFLWAVAEGPNRAPAGEFLIGPTDVAGDLSASLTFADAGAGTYYIATPYDWGETTFAVVEPTPTATDTATATPTSQATNTARSTHVCQKTRARSRVTHCRR